MFESTRFFWAQRVPFSDVLPELVIWLSQMEYAWPTFPGWALNLLIAFAVWRVLVMLSCVAVLVIPLYRGPASVKKHLWLIRKRFSPEGNLLSTWSCDSHICEECWITFTFSGDRMPFLVPNRCMTTLFELVSNALYFIIACLNYQVSPFFRLIAWLVSAVLKHCLCHRCIPRIAETWKIRPAEFRWQDGECIVQYAAGMSLPALDSVIPLSYTFKRKRVTDWERDSPQYCIFLSRDYGLSSTCCFRYGFG